MSNHDALDVTQQDSGSVTADAITQIETQESPKPGEEYVRHAMRFNWWAKIKWLWTFYMRFKPAFTGLVLLTPVHALVIIMKPVVFRNIFDSLRNGPDSLAKYSDPLTTFLVGRGWTTAGELTWVFVGLASIAVLIYLLLQNLRAWMNCRLEMEFRQQVFTDISDFGPRFYGKYSVGDMVTRLSDDVAEKLSWFACSGIFRFYEAMMLVIFGVAVMVTLNPNLTLYTLAPLPVLIILYRASASRLDRRYDWLQSRITRLYDIMDACFSGIRVIKAYRQEKSQRRIFGEAVEVRRTAEIQAIKSQTVIESFYMYVWEFGLILALIAGGYMVIHDQITLGEYLAFDFFVMLMIMPMLDIGQFLVKGLQSAVSIDRLMELQNNHETRSQTGSASLPSEVKGDVSFESVSLSLDGKRKILDQVSFDVTAGSTIALVGKVGSGKSWAVNLIPRLIDPDSGSVTLDGRDLREFDITQLRGIVGYVSQEPMLFSDTIENNVRFGRDEIKSEDLNWAIEIAQLRSEIEKFPKGLQTPVGARGVTLSGGQKQRVAMARALCGKPRILILDDCTSALDARTEDRLWEALQNLPFATTAFIITHRTATLRNVDRILVFDQGRIIQDGAHADLIKTKSVYAELYKQDELAEGMR